MSAATASARPILAPGRIGSLELRNRIVLTPMGTNQERADGHLGEGILDFYEARAKGGVGLVITGVASVSWPRGAANPNQAAISEDRFLPDWQELARRCHRHGARVAAQLQHASKVAVEDIAAGRPMWVPSIPELKAGDLYANLTREERKKASSAIRAPGAKVAFHEMTGEDLASVAEAFAKAAERARRAGLDGVELHAGHGYLLSAFLSPASNQRSDDYGGSHGNRARLLVDVLRAVRARVGDDFPVWVRIDGCELQIEGGITPEDAQRTAEIAVAAGADALHVSAYADPSSGAAFTAAPLVHEAGGFLGLAAGVKKRIDVPVIAVGRIEPDVADAVLARGEADFIAMGRRLLAEPELVNLLSEGRASDARPCTYQYQCVGNVFLREPSRCAMNPAMGREATFAPTRAERAKHVVVVGGGPAGLEAARRAATRGHRVTLLESDAALGGRARIAARHTPEMAAWLAWAERQVASAGVELQLESVADPAAVAALAPDAVVLAIGATRAPSRLPGFEQALPLERLSELAEALVRTPGATVGIVGDDLMAVRAAEVLCESGASVTLIGGAGPVAPQMSPPRRWRALDLFERRGVQVLYGAEPEAMGPDGVALRGDDGARVVAADHVVWAGGLGENDAVASFRDIGAPVHVIGDANGARYLAASLLEAAELANAL